MLDAIMKIQKDVLHGRAEYGKQIVATLSQQLTVEYGRGFVRDDLPRMDGALS